MSVALLTSTNEMVTRFLPTISESQEINGARINRERSNRIVNNNIPQIPMARIVLKIEINGVMLFFCWSGASRKGCEIFKIKFATCA